MRFEKRSRHRSDAGDPSTNRSSEAGSDTRLSSEMSVDDRVERLGLKVPSIDWPGSLFHDDGSLPGGLGGTTEARREHRGDLWVQAACALDRQQIIAAHPDSYNGRGAGRPCPAAERLQPLQVAQLRYYFLQDPAERDPLKWEKERLTIQRTQGPQSMFEYRNVTIEVLDIAAPFQALAAQGKPLKLVDWFRGNLDIPSSVETFRDKVLIDRKLELRSPWGCVQLDHVAARTMQDFYDYLGKQVSPEIMQMVRGLSLKELPSSGNTDVTNLSGAQLQRLMEEVEADHGELLLKHFRNFVESDKLKIDAGWLILDLNEHMVMEGKKDQLLKPFLEEGQFLSKWGPLPVRLRRWVIEKEGGKFFEQIESEGSSESGGSLRPGSNFFGSFPRRRLYIDQDGVIEKDGESGVVFGFVEPSVSADSFGFDLLRRLLGRSLGGGQVKKGSEDFRSEIPYSNTLAMPVADDNFVCALDQGFGIVFDLVGDEVVFDQEQVVLCVSDNQRFRKTHVLLVTRMWGPDRLKLEGLVVDVQDGRHV